MGKRTKDGRKIDTYGTSKGIRQTGHGGCGHASPFREPQITISRRSGEDKRLRQSCQDLAKQDDAINPARDARANVADPVTCEEQCRGPNDGMFGPAMEGVDGHSGDRVRGILNEVEGGSWDIR